MKFKIYISNMSESDRKHFVKCTTIVSVEMQKKRRKNWRFSDCTQNSNTMQVNFEFLSLCDERESQQ